MEHAHFLVEIMRFSPLATILVFSFKNPCVIFTMDKADEENKNLSAESISFAKE